MKILQSFWRYWKWVCVALMTSFVILALLAAIITYFKTPTAVQRDIGQCLENGGTWDEGEGACQSAA